MIKKHGSRRWGCHVFAFSPLGQITKQYYDASGNLIRVEDRNNQTTAFTYDNRDRLIVRSDSDETVSFGYDAAGKRTSMIDSTGMTRYQYDPYHEYLTELTYTDGQTLALTYDKNGNRTKMLGPFGQETNYSYDSMNRLKMVGMDKDLPDATYSYYKNGLTKATTLLNGLTSDRTYSGLSLTGLVNKAGATSLSSYGYGYDANKNITSRVQNDK
ncbi:MAG: hypothetical protein K6T85_07225 [Gorillibacterium sp.]|nr:hypothetical protein [Gorillibacterium sp.]